MGPVLARPILRVTGPIVHDQPFLTETLERYTLEGVKNDVRFAAMYALHTSVAMGKWATRQQLGSIVEDRIFFSEVTDSRLLDAP
jgi:hypothetical protein